ncbi:MAG: hypothetical protein GY778_06340 [bacterium]|nr:hypothetical protein [bacterium]
MKPVTVISIVAGLVLAELGPHGAAARAEGGAIVGWGGQVAGVDLSSGFTAVAGAMTTAWA